MTIQSFFDTWNGRGLDADGGYGFQCVDVFKQYNKDVVGGPAVSGNAKDYWTKYPVDFYTREANTTTAIPLLGDVIIWGTAVGPYGHIAICTEKTDLNSFTSFDQNWPVNVDGAGNGLGVCHYQNHNYNGVLGWLRPKKVPSVVPEDPMKVKVDLGSPRGVQEVQAINSMIDDAEKKAKSAQDTINGFVSKWTEEWKLQTGTTLVDIEVEMNKLLVLEDRIQVYREKMEEVVGNFESDEALFKAMEAIDTELNHKQSQIEELERKLSEVKVPSGYKIWKSWNLFKDKYLVKMYKKEEVS